LKALIEILSLCLALTAAAAFDSEEWLAQRELFAREAERLQTAYSNCVRRVANPATEVTVPVEVFPNGSVKSSVSARKAMFFPDTKMIWAEDVLIRKYDEKGTVVAQVDARNCVVDRVARSGWAEGPARIKHGKAVFHGRGIYFSSADAYVMVFNDSSVETKDLSFGGLK